MTIRRIRAAGWAISEKPTSAQLTQIDASHALALDKTVAGDTLSGAVLFGGSSASLTFSGGGDLVVSGAGSTYQTQTGGRIILNDNDHPIYIIGRSLSRVAPILVQLGNTFHWIVDQNRSVVSVVAGIVGNCDLTRFMIDGATLNSVDIYMAVGTVHASVPFVMPGFVLTQRTVTTGVGAASWARSFGAPASGAAWYASGATQTVNMTVGATVNRATSVFDLQITDESGTGSQIGNIYHSVRLNFTGITDMRPA